MSGEVVLSDGDILCGGVILGSGVIWVAEMFWVPESIRGKKTFCVAGSF